MKPSWQVMKLIECSGTRPCVEVVAAAEPGGQGGGHARLAAPEPADVVAVNGRSSPTSGLPGKLPTWYSPAASQGSAISLVSASSESSEIISIDRRLDQHVAVAVAAQDRGQVEAEAVDAGLRRPSSAGRTG